MNRGTIPDKQTPAFPQMRVWNASLAEYEDTQQFPGMSLRDWFAGQAGSFPEDVDLTKFECLVGRHYIAEFGSIEHWKFVADAEAAWRFLHADAMIKARG